MIMMMMMIMMIIIARILYPHGILSKPFFQARPGGRQRARRRRHGAGLAAPGGPGAVGLGFRVKRYRVTGFWV